MQEVLEIKGMGCMHCVKSVEEALKNLTGVKGFEVEIGKATVEVDTSLTRNDLVTAIDEAGYEVVS